MRQPNFERLYRFFLPLNLALALLLSCQNPTDLEQPIQRLPAVPRETATQVSTIQALASGLYHGFLPLDEMSRLGDFGLGTFEHLDGEMIQVDGEVFRVAADGRADKPSGEVRTPFFVTTFFEPDTVISASREMDYDDLRHFLDDHLPSHNLLYAIRIRGEFPYLKTRSVPAQSEPYPPLSEVTQQQPTFIFENVRGVLVGFHFPEYFKDINVPGYHFHFLDSDRSGGGHVLEMRGAGLHVELDETPEFRLLMPRDSSEFRLLPLGEEGDTAPRETERQES